MIGTHLAGTATLTRFFLRKDRIKLPAWVAGFGLFVVYIGSALPTLAPSEADLAALSPLFSQPVGRMFTGPAFGMDAPTYERFFAAGYAPYLFLLAALMSIMLVTRHTRVEEQTGRAELLRANVTGRHSMLTAALLVAAITNALAFLVVTGASLAFGFAATGSVLVGLATALTGMAFAGVTAVTVQLSAYSRSAAGMAGLVLGIAFVLRALGDMAGVGGTALSWASPLGWGAQTAPYVYDRWAPLALLVLLGVVGIATGFVLQSKRDFGASLVAPSPGPATAGPLLRGAIGLAARLQRGALLGWGAGIVALGMVDGAFTQEMLGAADDMPAAFGELFGTEALLDGYISFLGGFVAILAAGYAVYAMQSTRDDESHGRAETILATPVTRSGWLGSHVLVVACGIVGVVVVAALGTALAAAVVTGDAGLIPDVVAAHLAVLPAPLLVLGVCVALFGWAPRLMASVGWLLVALTAVVTMFGEMLDLPAWVRWFSPLHHLAEVPVEPFALTAFLVVTVVAALAMGIGLVGFRRREIGAN